MAIRWSSYGNVTRHTNSRSRTPTLLSAPWFDDAIVMHLPTMSGGFGKENLRHYYADVFIPGIPADTNSELIARSVGDSLLVDEFIMRMTHDQDIPFLLPGLARPNALAAQGITGARGTIIAIIAAGHTVCDDVARVASTAPGLGSKRAQLVDVINAAASGPVSNGVCDQYC
ncbi:MAG: hypothetical protein JWP83_655 [Mycobacterium sp.]|nr:hypothetical protein [Mycobacterium sp.]